MYFFFLPMIQENAHFLSAPLPPYQLKSVKRTQTKFHPTKEKKGDENLDK